MFSRHKVGPLESSRILEIGCGTGYWIRAFLQWGAHPDNVFGIDLLPERIELARKLCPEGVHLECANATSLAFPDSSFDLVLQSTVFTSILDETMKKCVAGEMFRVLRPTGFVLWYDFMFNNPRNPDVRGVRMSEIRKLFPGGRIYCRRVTLVPLVGRLLGSYSPLLYHLLSRTKILCTHYLCLIAKN
jgi:ubiquinone/menaquinone biosynthesis C-methylase UbiE